MCLHIDSLPNELLLVIFDRIPLSDLLHLDRVCHRWANLLTSACARRRTLVLIRGDKQLDELNCYRIPFNDTFDVSFDGLRPYFDLPVSERFASLTLPELIIPEDYFHVGLFEPTGATQFCAEMVRFHNAHRSRQLVTYLTEQFPNVDNLVMIHSQCFEDELHTVIGLVGFWALSILKLWIRTGDIDRRYKHRTDQHPVRTLLHSINRQSSLRQLTLEIVGASEPCDSTIPLESYSFIAQLKVLKLRIGDYDHDNVIWDSVHRFYGPKLGEISLETGDNLSMEMMVLNPKYEFTSKVRQLYDWNLKFATVEQFGEFCWRYCSLTRLQINWYPSIIPFAQLVSNLASLTQCIFKKF